MVIADSLTRALLLDERGRVKEAFRVLLLAARRRDSSVFVNLGFFYNVGRGVRRSRRKALRWYREAASLGHAAAAHNMATVYRDRGDSLRTIRWLEEAIHLGDSGSNVLLGQVLLGRLGQPEEALARFRAVAGDACEADVEAARVWTAIVEGMIATSDRRGRRTRG
jgi:TPR repeat protein